jgi:hypothetical protein
MSYRKESMSMSFDPRTVKVHARGPIVDLKLAQTYIPGLYCLMRCAFVIGIMTRATVSQDMAILLVMCVLGYVDRTTRNESIFDSNGVVLSILLSHMLNLLRVREVPMESHFVRVNPDQTTVLTKMGVAVQVVYCAVSMFSVSEYSFTDIGISKMSSDTPRMLNKTMCIHATLMSLMIFIHINPSSMTQTLTIGRSLSFTTLVILWSYVVGVKNTVNSLHMKEYCKQEVSLNLNPEP